MGLAVAAGQQGSAGRLLQGREAAPLFQRNKGPSSTSSAGPQGGGGGGPSVSDRTTSLPWVVSVWEEGAFLTPYPPFASRGELLAFEQSRHQLPLTRPQGCQPGASQLCPPAQTPPSLRRGA